MAVKNRKTPAAPRRLETMTAAPDTRIKINRLQSPNKAQINRLVDIWEEAVRATHHFLPEDDLQSIKALVGEALPQGEVLVVAEDFQGGLWAFLLVEHKKIDMLFVDPKMMRTGLGKKLIDYALKNLEARRVEVNVQNTTGLAFYRHLGFEIIGRSERDQQGRPFPLWRMEHKP